jgi:hypothetical protein
MIKKSKIYLTNNDDNILLFGLYFKDIEESNEYILAISTEKYILENMAEYYLDSLEKQYYCIRPVEIFQLQINNLVNQVKNMLFTKKIRKYELTKLEYFNSN